jgi:hypothetical protein
MAGTGEQIVKKNVLQTCELKKDFNLEQDFFERTNINETKLKYFAFSAIQVQEIEPLILRCGASVLPLCYCCQSNKVELIVAKLLQYPIRFCKLDQSGSIAIEHLPHHPKVEGSSPATTAGSGGQIVMKKA